MSLENLRDESVRRGISLYQVKKERNDNKMRQLEKLVDNLKAINSNLRESNTELIRINELLKQENNSLIHQNDLLTHQNESLKLEHFSRSLSTDDGLNIFSQPIPQDSSFIPIPDILQNISPSITDETSDNFVRLMYT